MSTHTSRWTATLSAGLLCLALAACGNDNKADDGKSSATVAATTEASASATPTSSMPPESEDDGQYPPHYALDTQFPLPNLEMKVLAIVEKDHIQATPTDTGPDLQPGPGQRLWIVEIEWTNTTGAEVNAVCHAPENLDFEAYDWHGNQMIPLEDQSYLNGNDCSTTVAPGAKDTFRKAFTSNGSDFGWLLFEAFDNPDRKDGREAVVVANPNVEVTLG